MTQIFKDRAAFREREDKKVNGVTAEFAEQNPNWEKENESNEKALADMKRCAELEAAL